MKYLRLNLAIPILLSCFLSPALATPVIKVRVAEFPPNYYQKQNGDWTGLGVELSTLILDAAGLKPEFANQPWARSLESLKSGSIQYITNISKTDERSQFLYWIGPVRQGEVRLIVKAGNENLPIKTLADLVTVLFLVPTHSSFMSVNPFFIILNGQFLIGYSLSLLS